MPRHEAPNNPSCYIDCEGGGVAYYREPDGPCIAFCEDGPAEKLAVLLAHDVKAGNRISLTISGMPGKWVADALEPLIDKQTIDALASTNLAPPLSISGIASEMAEGQLQLRSLGREQDGEG